MAEARLRQEQLKAVGTTEPTIAAGRGRLGRFWRRYRQNRMAVLGLFIVALFIFTGLAAPWLAPYSYRAQNLDAVEQSPSLEHPLGTDRLGRDQFSRIIWGARTALIVAPTATVVVIFLGLFFGLLAGYFGSWVDYVIMRLSDVLFAFPGLLFALLIAATLQPRFESWLKQFALTEAWVESGYAEFLVVITALSVVGWPGMARLVRGQVLSLREELFIEAAEALGVPRLRILFRHLLPNALPPVVVAVSMSMGGAIVAEATLSFLGIGIQPPTASWGAMIFNNWSFWRSPAAPWLVWAPGFVVAALVFAFNVVGDGLNDALTPHEQ